jgi:hypothetical protein
MRNLRFEWNRSKDKANLRNHGVSFDEAKTVFYDENAIEFYDQEHSGGSLFNDWIKLKIKVIARELHCA